MEFIGLIKKYWYVIIIAAIVIYIAYPKYSGESSVCSGNIECKCFGYAYTTLKGLDAPYINQCIGIAGFCKRTSEPNIKGCP